MASVISGLSHLTNPLASPEQLLQSASQSQNVPTDLQESIRYHACCTIQTAGILLRLPQQIVAETIVIFSRFWLGPTGGSLLEHSAKDVAAASLYLATKPGPYPLSPRQILNVFFYVTNVPEDDHTRTDVADGHRIPLYSEGTFQADRAALIKTESQILRVLGFQTHVALPHALCMNYLQTLDALGAGSGHDLAHRAYAHLNTALLSPQLIYLTHQPNALAVAAIYLGAREAEVNLPDQQWWEVFDVDREELGFLVVAMTSMPGFVQDQKTKYRNRAPPLTIQEVKEEMSLRNDSASDR